MGNLPRDRVVPDYPFNCSAIHIEIVSDLTSDAFIATLKRFFSRRGKCAKLYSDNGKTFVDANKELKRFLKLIEDSDDNLAGFLSAEGCKSFEMYTNCSSEPTTPVHILECLGLTKQDLADDPLLVLESVRCHWPSTAD
ncbi:integrase catalytic domain-containing protein [Trichonephila clavipes]|nr:integrase catalytic domain-containing protein [Trichonephila clavipes]